MGKRKARCEIQKYLPPKRRKEWFNAYSMLEDCSDPAIICRHCETVVDEDEPCDSCYFFCYKCEYYFLHDCTKKGYEGEGPIICEFCIQVEEEKDKEPPDEKQPE